MFQNQNTNAAAQATLSQEKDLHIEDIPIHTMKKDLEAIKHPEKAQAEIEVLETTVQANQAREKLNPVQKSSPFLDFSPERKPAPETPQPTTVKVEEFQPKIAAKPEPPRFEPPKTQVYRPEPRVEIPKPEPKKEIRDSRITLKDMPPEKGPMQVESAPAAEPKHHLHINYGRIFAIISIVLIVAILIGGGYYFWSTRQKPAEVTVVQPAPEPAPEPTPEPPKPTFKSDSSNNLTVDLVAMDAAGLKAVLQKYATDVAAAKMTTPVEFTVVDANDSPVLFQDFAKKINLVFSPALSANLEKTFSLFIYNDGSVTRLGLALNSKSPLRLKALLAAEEKNLAKELEPIFLTSDYTLEIKSFGGSTYNNQAIRYANITSPEDLSVDYTLNGSKLLIGTTKMTLRSIIDYVATVKAVPAAQTVNMPATTSPQAQTAPDLTSTTSPSPTAGQTGIQQ